MVQETGKLLTHFIQRTPARPKKCTMPLRPVPRRLIPLLASAALFPATGAQADGVLHYQCSTVMHHGPGPCQASVPPAVDESDVEIDLDRKARKSGIGNSRGQQHHPAATGWPERPRRRHRPQQRRLLPALPVRLPGGNPGRQLQTRPGPKPGYAPAPGKVIAGTSAPTPEALQGLQVLDQRLAFLVGQYRGELVPLVALAVHMRVVDLALLDLRVGKNRQAG